MKKILCILILLLVCVFGYYSYSNMNYKKFVKSFGSNYRTKLSYYKLKDISLVYDYNNNVEVYFDDSLNDVEYRDYNKEKKYRFESNKFIISPIISESNNKVIYELLNNLKVKSYFNGTFTFFENKKNTKNFLEHFSDYIIYDSNDNYRVTVKVQNNYISELKIISSNDKYLKFKFSKFNKIGRIQSPVM